MAATRMPFARASIDEEPANEFGEIKITEENCDFAPQSRLRSGGCEGDVTGLRDDLVVHCSY